VATVLVVDDEFGIGEILEAILGDEGHQVVLAMNGRQALEKLASEPVDLVISDYMMPIMDGASLYKALRQNPQLDGCAFVFMSSLPEASVVDGLNGYDGFLRKPFRIPAVIATVEQALKKHEK
jgi:CheY-like chemotaxis protein